MDKKPLLTSMIALGFAVPAFAETFPADKLMGENKVYENAAIYDNMGVYEGVVYANAVYTDAAYSVSFGEYLPMNSADVAGCLNGYYCPGFVEPVNFSSSNDQGLTKCPTGYTSDSGASSVLQCYKTCDVADFPHALAVSNGYYAFGAESCAATSCDSGWHLADVASVDSSSGCGVNSEVYPYFAVSSEAWACSHSVNSGTDSSVSSGTSVNSSVQASLGDGAIPGMWSVGYSDYALRGMARLSSTRGYEATLSSDPSTATTSYLGVEGGGEHCWCNIVGYRSAASQWYAVASSPWTYAGSISDDSNALGRCTTLCANFMGNTSEKALRFRRTIRGDGSVVKRICSPNRITIHWNGTTSQYVNANNAGTAQYEGDVRTPVMATPRPGKIFQGWQFSRTALSE
ncbi:MAG: hypothetical protein IKF41_04095 [Alphaproteobacteria bacterium]|nr:hypothetical protein [Alphaproteobacteria bacterium]